MDLMLSSDQEAVRDAIRDVLHEHANPERLRAVLADADAFEPRLWTTAAELGWFGLAVPEAAGGAGYGLPEAMVLFVELGRTLAPGPWLGTVLAAQGLAMGVPRRERLAGVLAGRERVALIDDPDGRLGMRGAVDGEAANVVDGGIATSFLVLGASNVRLVEGKTATRVVHPCIDPTRRLATVRFAGAAAEACDAEPQALRRAAAVLAAAEAGGVAERTIEMSVEYGKVREQFGRPIGSFQAIKHRCADMAVRAEVARSAVTYAAVALEEGLTEAPLAVHIAKALATDAAIANATDNIQNHGGIGYTWEAEPHLYLKRARLLEHVLGTRTEHLDAIAAPWRAAS
jgi:alkylation response protein AidB-like acyl-CoA dehydrogenase